MSNLYIISKEVEDLFIKLNDTFDPETGEIDTSVFNDLTAKKEEFENKASNMAAVIRMYDRKIAEVKAEIKRLSEIEKTYNGLRERLCETLTIALEQLNFEKIDNIKARISFRKSKRIIIDDERAIPDKFKITEINVKIKKDEIKKAINNGDSVNGAHIEDFKNIQIR